MSKALIAGINQVATDKGLDREVIFQAIEAALVSAYRRNYGSISNVSAEVDRMTGDMRVFAEREVVEDVMNPRTEVTEQEARKAIPTARLGDVVRVPTAPDDFGRIAAQTAKQVILQRIREAERDTVYENFAHQVGEIVSTQIRSIDAQSGAVTVLLGEKHEILMMREDLIAAEKLRRGDFIKVYVVDVHKSTRGPVIKLSRTHRNLLRRLMEQEIPEVRDGIVEIKAIAREPGARSKVAVIGTVPGIDPVGSCVGMRGLRIQNIVNELAGEKIDVIEWSTDIASYITNALSPAKVSNVILDENSSIKTAVVVVPDRQLSLAIGKEGQNARLAAKLTGWRIDIKSESEAQAEGLDKLAGERARRAASASEDLLTMAERILRNEDESVPSSTAGDRLWQAMQSLQDLPSVTSETLDTFGKAAASEAAGSHKKEPKKSRQTERPEREIVQPAEEAEELVIPSELVVPEWPTEALTAISEPTFSLDEIKLPEVEALPTPIEPAAEPTPEPVADVTEVTALPQVITADMLRARMAQRKGSERKAEEIEIPAELLIGIEETEEEAETEAVVEDWEEEIEGGRGGKGKGKAKSKKPSVPVAKPGVKAKKKKRRPVGDEDDDYRGYY